VPADARLLRERLLGDKPYAHLGHPLMGTKTLIPSTSCRPPTYCNLSATGLVHAGTEWTKRLRQIVEYRLNRRNFRTHQYGLERTQANS